MNLLAPNHAAMIAASGISPEVAAARGYRSITDPAEALALGFAPYQARVPALLVPVHGVNGGIILHQSRPDNPRAKDGKIIKYETPKGARMVLDIPPAVLPALRDASLPLIMTEGVRKADSAVSHGGNCIALLGVWSWRGTNPQGDKAPLDDFDAVNLNERTVYICFDSDVMMKESVRGALDALTRFLRSRGACVRHSFLPAAPDGGKQGLDDYLADHHSIEDVYALARAPVQESAGEDAPLYRVYTAAELKALPPLQFDVEDIIPENAFGTIIGKPGAMKSFLALDFALSQATGAPWHGKEVRRRRVLYIAAEGKGGMGGRVAAWEAARHIVVDDGFFLIADAPQLLNAANEAAVIATARLHGAGMVYLDTLARTIGGDENGPDMGRYVAAVNRIMGAIGGGAVVVHHMGWNGEHGRGNSALFGAADFELTVAKDGDTVTMRVTKAKDFLDGAVLTFAPRVIPLDNGGSSVALDTAERGPYDVSATERRVAAILLETFGAEGATATQWQKVCHAAGIDDATFYRAKKQLTEAAHLNLAPNEKAKRGWHLTLTESFTLTLTSLSRHSHERDSHSLSHSHSPYRGESDESESEGAVKREIQAVLLSRPDADELPFPEPAPQPIGARAASLFDDGGAA